MTKAKSLAVLAFFVLLCLGVGGLGALAMTPEIPGWYRSLVKPSWNPPAAVFGPVWTTLYVLMAIAAWLVWRTEGPRPGRPLMWFFLQLLLNLAWSWIFFYFHQPGWAFADLVLLWGALAVTTFRFVRAVPLAGWLLVPYLAWVTFAGALNLAIWRLNA